MTINRSKMKYLTVALTLMVFIEGCRVCQISYKAISEINKETPTLAKDSLTVTCGIVSTNKKRLHLLFRFFGEVRQQRINNIQLMIVPEDKVSLILNKVTLAPSKFANTETFLSQHTANNFALLPDDYKLTSLDGQVVNYYFDYVSDRPIISENINILLEVELQNGKRIKYKEDFARQKNCYYSIH